MRRVMADGGVELERDSVYAIGSLKFWALGDRLIILQDEFQSGYECQRCLGKQEVACGNCGGQGRLLIEGRLSKKCSHCDGQGTMKCPDCEGKGGLLVIPENKQQRPGSGKIVSVGPECKTATLGDWVLYSQFAGHAVDLSRDEKKYVLRILHETEILCGMAGSLDLKTLRGKSEIAEFHK
jgi:co-chaperonin GroES (HSP10)